MIEQSSSLTPTRVWFVTLLMLTVLLVLLVRSFSAWSLQQELKAELLALSSPSHPAKGAVENFSLTKENQSELRRLLGSHAALATSQAAGQTDLIAQSSIAGAQVTLGERLPDGNSTAFTEDSVNNGLRTSLDNIVSRAKGAGIEVVSAQTTGIPGTSDPQSTSVAVKGSYSALRTWLIEVTDADTGLVLGSLHVRRERLGQSAVAGEIKFVRIDSGVPR